MSPRRMDISSLLRDPSPPSDDPPPRHPDRPRTIDALLHRPQQPDSHPASLLAILNSPSRDRPDTHPSPRTAPPHHPVDHSLPRPPFLGLDALVHVASEERRRIAAVSDRDTETEFATHLDRDNPPIRVSLVHDHDWPSRHYSSPYSAPHRHSDFPSPSHDSSRPYKRARETTPRSPSPDSKFSHLTSPSTRHHSSASPTNNYPTLRRQLIEPTPSRSAPAPLAANDARAVSLQHTSTFLHSPHPLQLPSHSSPRTNSSLHHSPQHLRSQHHSSPVLTPSLGPVPSELDTMSPRYGHGPKMAGGIQVLSNDLSAVRDSPRPILSNYQSPGRDMSSERFVSDARHEQSKLSPLSARVFSLDNATHQPRVPSHQVEIQESALLRDCLRPPPPHLPLFASVDDGTDVVAPAMENDFPTQSLPERHPIRVWEDQPTVRETSRRVSPACVPSIVCDPREGGSWPEVCKSDEPLSREGRGSEPLQDVAENAPPTSLFPSKKPPSSPAQMSEPLVSGSRALVRGNRLDPQPTSSTPLWSRTSVHPDSHALLQTLYPDSSILSTPASPISGPQPQSLETQSECQRRHSDVLVDVGTSAPQASSDQNTTEPSLSKTNQTSEATDANDIPVTDPRPPPGPVGMSQCSTHVTTSQSTSRSPSRHPLSILLPAKDEHSVPPEDILISSPTPQELPSRRSPGAKSTPKLAPSAPEQTVMDVDEELLSLVEDHPPRVLTSPKIKAESGPPLSAMVDQGIGTGVGQGSREPSDGSLSGRSTQPTFRTTFMTDEENDRASALPTVALNKKVEKDKTTLVASTATGGRKKKDGTLKPANKSKQHPKPRARPTPKAKSKPSAVDSSSKGSILKGAVNVNARSRSTSVIPGAADDIVPEPEADNSDKEDDKLYCVCKTRYDEDRMMIACDRCDEWFHTLCVNVSDLEIDLVDQFICPPCIQKYPHLQTTWKRRCLFGLQHENPSSPEACHKPSRGVFSKYCSDECGTKYMQVQIAQWEKSGGARDLLWESVKNAPKREGVVVCAKANNPSPGMMHINNDHSVTDTLNSVAKRRAEREVARLNARLEEVVGERELMKRELEMVLWREKVVELASERARKVDECGWDQRLCFGEEEWTDFGPEVLESYGEARAKEEVGDNVMSVDVASIMHGEWWCTGKKKCERHAGWQKLRVAEVSFDRETKEGVLLKLTTREREIRKLIEDILYPQPTATLQAPPKLPLLAVQLNGTDKLHFTSHVSERAKKRTS